MSLMKILSLIKTWNRSKLMLVECKDDSWWIRRKSIFIRFLFTELNARIWVVNRKYFLCSSSSISFLVWRKFINSCKRNLTALKFFDGEEWERNLWIYFDFLWFSCQHKSSCLEGELFFRANSRFFYYEFRVQFMCLLHFLMAFYDVCNLSQKNKFSLCRFKFMTSWTHEMFEISEEIKRKKGKL